METVEVKITAYRVEGKDTFDVAFAVDSYEPVQIWIDDLCFEDDARHLQEWAKKYGFKYYEGSEYIKVRVCEC